MKELYRCANFQNEQREQIEKLAYQMWEGRGLAFGIAGGGLVPR